VTIYTKCRLKQPLGRSGHRWKNLEINLEERGWGGWGLDSSASVNGTLVGVRKHGNEPSWSVESGEFFE
jgi:hypothetical protein